MDEHALVPLGKRLYDGCCKYVVVVNALEFIAMIALQRSSLVDIVRDNSTVTQQRRQVLF